MTRKEITAEMLDEARKIADEQFDTGNYDSAIGFCHDDMWIINPWYEESGRFEVKDPFEYYGEDKVVEFISVCVRKPSLRKSVFAINDEDRFIGYTTGAHWNGWACPMFTRDEAMRIVKYVNRTSSDINDYNMGYDFSLDQFYYYDCNIEEREIFKMECFIDPDTGEVLELYAIGAYSWIWDDLFEK